MAAVMNNVSVPKQSDEHNQIEHYLSMCLNSLGLVSDLNIWRIDNAQVTSDFDRTTGGLLRLPAWVNTEELPEDNCLDEICQYGFQLHNTKGMSFSTGNIPNLIPNADVAQQLVYCELAVGRARVCDPAEIAPTSTEAVIIPEGYDSLYVPQERVDRNNDGELTMDEYDAAANFEFRDASMYNHQYFIKEGQHVNPRYIVEFMLLPQSSDDEVVSVMSGVEPEGVSKEEEDAHDFFDPVMYRSVSLKEKMSSVNLSRRLIPIEKAYDLAQEEAHKEDSILNSKLAWIDSRLSDVDVSVRKVNMNYAEQYDEIVAASEKAIAQLQQLSKSKLELLLGVEMELRREREEIEWIEGFINEKSNQAPALCEKNRQEYLHFLNAWKSHAILRNGLSRAKPQEINILGNIQPNMVVHSEIIVSTIDKLPSTLHALKERNQQSNNLGIQKDEENMSVKSSAFNECLHDAKHFFNAVATNSGLYSNQPAKPLESLISPDAQAMVDRNLTKIESALKTALAESASSKHMMPLPDSITRPTVSGTPYPLPDDSPFNSAYNEMGNNENYTEEQLQLEMEKNIQQYAKSEFQSSEVDEEPHGTASHRPTLTDLRPLEQNNQIRQERLKQERAESSRGAPFMNSTSQHSLTQSSSTPAPGFLTATEEFDGDLVSYLEQVTEQYRPTYSLDEGATRRKTQLSTTNVNFHLAPESVFFESDILEPEQAESVYLNLPFFSKPPECQFLYSSQRDGCGLDQLYEALEGTKGPNVLLIQSGDFIFGAYVNQTLLPTEDKWTGSPSCFLFSVTFDLKLPYHGRNPAPGKGKVEHPCAFFANVNNLLFGNGDIQLDGELETGSSHLEGCFGLGLPKTSHATSTLLAGVGDFTIDKLEVWHISSVV